MTFLLVALVVIVAPGPDFALTVRNAVTRGRRAGLATAAGLVAILLASQTVFTALRLAGAAYLVYLGLSALRHAWRGVEHEAPRRLPVSSPYAQGLVSNLSNPKIAVFFASVLPQFGSTFGALAGHGLAFAALTLAWLALVARAGSALRAPFVRRTIDAVTGVVLTALGVDLAATRR